VTALIAAVPGLVDWISIRADHPAKRTATWHMVLNLLVVILYAINVGVRWPRLDVAQAPALPMALSIFALVILSVSGYLGGAMIYDDGVGVGRHRRQTRLPGDTIRVSGEPGTFVPVATVDRCGERQTLRAQVNGNVMMIVNVGGEFMALQEFCTHRYGPLSEGQLDGDAQIMCPWHRSCFDLRSGKVTQGPAKVDAKTYRVEVRDGQICVQAD
jgi:nitrite reductase/ring-hydroxylating ferredoxin subunit